MNGLLRHLLLLAAVFFSAASHGAEPLDGPTLAREISEIRPDKPVDNTAVLRRREPGNRRSEVPVRFQLLPETDGWRCTYEVPANSSVPAEKLVIIHRLGRPSEYLYAKTDVLQEPAGELKPLDTTKLMQPFAGSDFWLADLGLEFLHWPQQRLVKTEMRRGQSCRVLESIRPGAKDGYTRVLSWIDIDTGGLVQAEAYDSDNHLVKEFSPREFQKVHGQWQVKELEIRNQKTDTRTRLEFQLDEK